MHRGSVFARIRVSVPRAEEYAPEGTDGNHQNPARLMFDIDDQTRKDLELFGDTRHSDSVFSFFDHTRTAGGRERLAEWLRTPTNDLETLGYRRDAIRFFCDHDVRPAIKAYQVECIEQYYRLGGPVLRNNPLDALFRHLSAQLKPDNNYYRIQTGIQQLILLFRQLARVVEGAKGAAMPAQLAGQLATIDTLLAEPEIRSLCATGKRLSFARITRFDNLLRKKFRNPVLALLGTVYTLDAAAAVAQAVKANTLCFPEYLPGPAPRVDIEGLTHPLLEHPVENHVRVDGSHNLVLLTGPNMAGKSTFLKALGLAVYLAHAGFPVPARRMQTSLYNGLVTTINLPDNVKKGYSHFYTEVVRVRETAEKIRDKGTVFVIFDELFRGTNVKDAFDASLLIATAFARIRSSTFFVSTHITQVARELAGRRNVRFGYFDSRLEGGRPVYSYCLHEGVSEERLGLLIVQNEKITEILDSIGEGVGELES
jgi:DNA mismatch repair ATPase MutS